VTLRDFVRKNAVDIFTATPGPFRPEAGCMLHVGRVGATVLANMLDANLMQRKREFAWQKYSIPAD
jgi:hypothetical protein